MANNKKTDELRGLLISGLTRQQMIDFIQLYDSFYNGASFAGQSDEQLRELAISVDKQVRADRQKKKKENELQTKIIASRKSITRNEENAS